jgi:hypothetical protein
LSKNNSVLDSKVLQTLEFVEVMLPLFFWFGLSTSLSTLRVLGHIMTTNWKQLVQQPFYSKIVYFLASNATPSTLRLGRTPRTSGPEIKSKKYDGYQHNLTSHLMTKRRKQPMSDTVKTVRYQLSISQNTENLAVATLHQQREIKD